MLIREGEWAAQGAAHCRQMPNCKLLPRNHFRVVAARTSSADLTIPCSVTCG